MLVSAAFTAPVNAPGASPVLSHAQLWRGHEIKAEAPQPFVPVSSCEVLERRPNGITRRVIFKSGGPVTPGTPATEDIEYFGNTRVDFNMREKYMRVSNIISRGAGGEDDLYLTYTFVIDYPDVEEGSSQAAVKVAEVQRMSAGVVPHVIKTIRSLVVEGKI